LAPPPNVQDAIFSSLVRIFHEGAFADKEIEKTLKSKKNGELEIAVPLPRWFMKWCDGGESFIF
jgi:hypothetical protein